MLTAELYPYQDEAVDRSLDLGYGLIAYEMGLGKTICALAIVEELLAAPSINFALIVVPASLKYQWAESIAKFTDVTTRVHKIKSEQIIVPTEKYCVVIEGPPDKRQQQYDYVEDNWPNYVICSYNQVVDDFDRIYDLSADCVVLDEASAIKSFKAKRSKKIKALNPEFAIALTGTPVENRPEELYSIMEFVKPGYLGSFQSFDVKYIVRNHWGGVKRYRNLDLLYARMKSIMSRKTRLDPDVAPFMPEVDKHAKKVPLDAKSRKLYRQISKEIVADLAEAKVTDKFDLHAYYSGQSEQDMSDAGKIMAKCMALQMLCDHPDLLSHSADLYYDTDGANGSKYAFELDESGALEGLTKSGKFDLVVQDVRDILDSNSRNKIIIFSFFKEMGKVLQKELGEYDSVLFTGDMSATEKAAAKARFQQREGCRLFIASDAGGYGVDLPQANYLINYDLAESAGKMDQRNARHVRAGSKHSTVYIVSYLTEGTVEERVYRRLEFKRRVASAIIDGSATASEGVIENDVDSLTDFLVGALL